MCLVKVHHRGTVNFNIPQHVGLHTSAPVSKSVVWSHAILPKPHPTLMHSKYTHTPTPPLHIHAGLYLCLLKPLYWRQVIYYSKNPLSPQSTAVSCNIKAPVINNTLCNCKKGKTKSCHVSQPSIFFVVFVRLSSVTFSPFLSLSDMLFLQGSEVIFKVALSLLGSHKPLILQHESLESIVDFIKTTLPNLGLVQMEKTINQVRIAESEFCIECLHHWTASLKWQIISFMGPILSFQLHFSIL